MFVDEFQEISEVSCAYPTRKSTLWWSHCRLSRRARPAPSLMGDNGWKKVDAGVWFDGGVRRKLVEFENSKDAVSLTNCEVKRSRRGEQLEVLVAKKTKGWKRARESGAVPT